MLANAARYIRSPEKAVLRQIGI